MNFPHDRELIEKTAKCFRFVYQTPGRYINDHCFVSDGTQWHCFYIDGEVGKGCYDLGNEQIIGHAVSNDLLNWRHVGNALESDGTLPHEERGIYAPYVIQYQGLWHLFYASHNMDGAQYLCHAVSNDLEHWTRDREPLFYPTFDWSYWKADVPCSCRDPHVILNPADGLFYLYWVADLSTSKDASCIALSTSENLKDWTHLGPVLSRKYSFYEGLVMKTESPCLIEKNGLFYLFYRHGDGTYYCISDTLTDFSLASPFYLGPCHASEIFNADGRWVISSCSRPPEDITHKFDRTGGLWLAGLEWSDVHPKIVSL